MIVFVPLPLVPARALRAGGRPGALKGFAVTPALVRALGPDLSDEEADFAALSSAGLAALERLEGGRRLVLAADVGPDQVTDGGREPGEVRVDGLGWSQVTALFADEDAAADAVRAAAAELVAAAGTPADGTTTNGPAIGRPSAGALEGPAVTALTDTYDLLWYAPEELDALG